MNALRLFSGSSHPALARAICECLAIRPGDVELCHFDDENVFATFREDLSGRDVFLLQAFHFPVNLSIMELLIMADAARRAAAGRITAVIPYFAYGRSDSRMDRQVPITARLLADLITVAGVNRVVTIDLHSSQTEGFFNIPVDALTALNLFAAHFRHGPERVVVAPHEGSTRWAKSLSEKLGFPLAIIEKRAVGPEVGLNILGDVKGRQVLLVENQVDSGNSLATAAAWLRGQGVAGISAVATHAVLAAGSVSRLAAAPIDELVVTDSLPVPEEATARLPIRIIPVGPLLGEAVRRIHEYRSTADPS